MNNYFVDLVLFSLDGSAINGIDSMESSSALLLSFTSIVSLSVSEVCSFEVLCFCSSKFVFSSILIPNSTNIL